MSHGYESAVLSAQVLSLLVKPFLSLSFQPPPLFPVSLCFPSLFSPVRQCACLPASENLCALLVTHPHSHLHYLAYGRSFLKEMSECITIIDNSWPCAQSLLLGDRRIPVVTISSDF